MVQIPFFHQVTVRIHKTIYRRTVVWATRVPRVHPAPLGHIPLHGQVCSYLTTRPLMSNSAKGNGESLDIFKAPGHFIRCQEFLLRGFFKTLSLSLKCHSWL